MFLQWKNVYKTDYNDIIKKDIFITCIICRTFVSKMQKTSEKLEILS